MSVIPFPYATSDANTDAGGQPLAAVVAAICSLGEPARLDEVCEYVRSVMDMPETDTRNAVLGALLAYSRSDDDPASKLALFRPVALRGREAWALTADFRQALRHIGVSAELRSLSG